MRSLLLLVAMAAPVAADPIDRVAVAVNSPIGWDGDTSLAISGYVALTDHQAIRANVASYANDGVGRQAAAAIVQDDGDGGYYGRTTDVGVGWMYFLRRVYDGPMLELGALVRHRNITDTCDQDPPYSLATQTDTLAARAVVGWSWLIRRRVFIAIAAGASIGYERGTQATVEDEDQQMPTIARVHRLDVEPEAFLRVGTTL